MIAEHDDDEIPEDEEEVDPYDLAREITEHALEAYANDDKEFGDQLIEAAKEIDADAVQDVYDELEEDADSQHDPQALNDKIQENQQKRA